jgi:hypothetical protein
LLIDCKAEADVPAQAAGAFSRLFGERAADYSARNGGRAVLVMIDGEIVFERYGNGGDENVRQMLASGSKSFVGAAVVATVPDDLIRLDDRARETITQWKPDSKKIPDHLPPVAHAHQRPDGGRARRGSPLASLGRDCPDSLAADSPSLRALQVAFATHRIDNGHPENEQADRRSLDASP